MLVEVVCFFPSKIWANWNLLLVLVENCSHTKKSNQMQKNKHLQFLLASQQLAIIGKDANKTPIATHCVVVAVQLTKKLSFSVALVVALVVVQ